MYCGKWLIPYWRIIMSDVGSEKIIPSSTWCVHPWQHSYVGTRYERKLCCISKDVKGYDKTSTADFWNSEFMKSTRRKMLEGEQVDECSSCYECERHNTGISPRQRTNSYLTKDHIDYLLNNTDVTGHFTGVVTYYDYRTIHCNLQCHSCNDVYSSQHITLKEKMNAGNVIVSDKVFRVDYNYEKACLDEIISSIESKHVDNIYWAGGEPMMSPIHWGVIEYMIEKLSDPEYHDYIKSIHMHYNTNLTKMYWKTKRIPEMLEVLQPVLVPSLDGVYETLEYTRDGAKWKDINKNFNEYISILNCKKQFGIATVLTAPVLFDIDRYLDYFCNYDVHLEPQYYYHNINDGLLSIMLYPEEIFFTAIQNARSRLKSCSLLGTTNFLAILDRYEKEYAELRATKIITEAFLGKLKTTQMHRDSFNITKRTMLQLYEITNPSAKSWIDSIKTIPHALTRG